MTETEAPTVEQIEGADYLELQGMAKAAGLKANESGDELRAALLAHHHGSSDEDGPQEAPEASEALEEGDGPNEADTSPQGAVEDDEDDDEPRTWRAGSNVMTLDGKRVIPAGGLFVAPRSDPRTRDAVEVEPERLTDAQLRALAGG